MPIKESVTIEETIQLLNEFVLLDPEAMRDLLDSRVECNEAVSNHPTIQVSALFDSYKVGLLGVLNGLFGVASDGYGAIAAVYDATDSNLTDGILVKGRLLGFKRIRK